MEKEMVQKMEWLEAQEIEISIDLFAAAKQHLQFLGVVDRNRWLYDGHALERAIYRYNAYWLPLLAKYSESSPICQGPLVPPFDCEWVWHCHRLNPVRYKSDCEQFYGRVLDNSGIVSSANGSCKLQTENLWKRLYPMEPYDLDLDKAVSGPKDISPLEKCTTYDLVSAVKRQSSFYYEVSRANVDSDIIMEEAVSRYKAFLYLIRRNLEKSIELISVPTNDIDLIWHTHQLNPSSYYKDTENIFGNILQHDDTDSDTSEGKKLETVFSRTTAQWEETFGLRYWKGSADTSPHTPVVAVTEKSGVGARCFAEAAEKRGASVRCFAEAAGKCGSGARCFAVAAKKNSARCFAVEAEKKIARCFAVAGGKNSARCFAVEAEKNSAKCFLVETKQNSVRCFALASGKNSARCFAVEAEKNMARCFAVETEKNSVRCFAVEAEKKSERCFAVEAEKNMSRCFAVDTEKNSARCFTVESEKESARCFAVAAGNNSARCFTVESEKKSARCFAVAAGNNSARCFAVEAEKKSARCFAVANKKNMARCFAMEAKKKSSRCFAVEAKKKSARCFAVEAEKKIARCFAVASKKNMARCFAVEAEKKNARCFAVEAEKKSARCFAVADKNNNVRGFVVADVKNNGKCFSVAAEKKCGCGSLMKNNSKEIAPLAESLEGAVAA